MYIFREGKNLVRGADLVSMLAEGVANTSSVDVQSNRTHLIDLLLRAGELECALADAESPQTEVAARITDTLGAALVTGASMDSADLAATATLIKTPEHVRVAPPEGFAYYSLHPLDLVEVVRRVEMHSEVAAIIGIRSIGTTLSAVVQATLRADGIRAQRITVRPSGHPYDRRTSFDGEQGRWIAWMIDRGAEFMVVDEGPGMSGSSFLSVGDALVQAGVPRESISFLCTREPDVNSLTVPDAAARWPTFRCYYTRSTRFLPRGVGRYIAGGIWRADVFESEREWPASWLQMERLKFLSKDGSTYYGFEGFGRFGEEVRNRAVAVAKAGFGPMPLEREEGFGVYPVIKGRSLRPVDANLANVRRLAEYCSFRAECITAKVQNNAELETMLRFNTQEEFGVGIDGSWASLPIVRPVIADGRMLPHKWIESEGMLLKVDSSTHGDNHFFPGPTDIAWDLAGTIVEWDVPGLQQSFLEEYQRISGDDAEERLPAYLLAYSIFRMAYSKMASAAMKGTEEEQRLVRDYHRYRDYAERLIGNVKQASIEVRSSAVSNTLVREQIAS